MLSLGAPTLNKAPELSRLHSALAALDGGHERKEPNRGLVVNLELPFEAGEEDLERPTWGACRFVLRQVPAKCCEVELLRCLDLFEV
jgi:hypothetical protein